jgi:hypothetical protein
MNVEILKEFGADLRLRDSENMGPTRAEVKMADEINRLRGLLEAKDELLSTPSYAAANWRAEAERLRAEIAACKAELAELRAGRTVNMPAYVRRTLNLARAVEEFQASGRAGFIVARADELDKKEEAAIDAARKEGK